MVSHELSGSLFAEVRRGLIAAGAQHGSFKLRSFRRPISSHWEHPELSAWEAGMLYDCRTA